MSKVIVFGSLNMDVSIDCDAMPRAGETVHGHGLVLNPGGKGGNQAVAAARMGADVRMLAALGADAFGGELRRSLEGSGVDCAEVVEDGDHATGTAVIVRSQGDNRIIVEPGANAVLGGADAIEVLDRVAEPGDVLLVQFECDMDATVQAVEHAHAAGLFTVVNPAPVHEVPASFWRSVDLVCLNETECDAVCGELPEDRESVERSLAALLGLGVGTAVITLGSRGSVARRASGEAAHVGSLSVDVVDTTGAGDTYLGALVAAHVRGDSLADAMRFASAAAALATTGLGAQQAIPSLEEVKASDKPALLG